jgi:hypothetical protein
MKYKELFENVVFSAKGLGGVPYNQDIDYFGKRVTMTPKVFLRLAARIPSEGTGSVEAIKQAIQQEQPIGQPFLSFDVPPTWRQGDLSQPIEVEGHEGRNRALAIAELYGDNYPMEVHLLFRGLRAHHVTPEWLDAINQQAKNEDGFLVKGPFFK